MYGNGASATERPTQPSNPLSVHNTAGQVAHRLREVNNRLEKLLARVRGSQPTETSDQCNKLAEEPSLLGHLGTANAELCTLEARIGELVEQIG